MRGLVDRVVVTPAERGFTIELVHEAAKLRDDLMRYRSLRTRTIDKRTRKAIDELIKETEERLRQLLNAMGDHDGF